MTIIAGFVPSDDDPSPLDDAGLITAGVRYVTGPLGTSSRFMMTDRVAQLIFDQAVAAVESLENELGYELTGARAELTRVADDGWANVTLNLRGYDE